MTVVQTSVKHKILQRLQVHLPGTILFVQDFQPAGTSDAVRQELTRLVKAGQLTRLCQGIYTIPKKLGAHELLPVADDVATALARRDKIRITSSGEVAIWKLGLTTQVPLNHVYLTDGPSKEIKVEDEDGKTHYTIKFKHAAPKNFALRGKISSQVIQAMRTLGRDHITDTALEKIRTAILRENMDDLNHDLALAPAWIAHVIRGFFETYKRA